MNIYYLHTDTLRYLVVHILTTWTLLSCITIGFIVNIFQRVYYFLLFNHETHFIYFFFYNTTFFKLFFYILQMYPHPYYGQ